MKRTHLALAGLSLTIVLLSVNRLTPFTSGYLQPHEFLRWLDFNAMLPIPLLSVILYFLLMREVVAGSPFRDTARYAVLVALFIAGVYLLGAGSGDHEVTNYLNARFCDSGNVGGDLCAIISYNDDDFSHYVYYAGVVLLNVSLILAEFAVPRPDAVSGRDLFFVGLNALLIGFGIFANLAFEEIGLDLFFFGAVMVLALGLLLAGGKKPGRLPVTCYFAAAYTFGVVGTLVYKAV